MAVLINNAGVIAVSPFEVMTLEDYEAAMRTHFWAPLYATPVPGLYACSASTPASGAVHGMCDCHAAQAAIRFLG